MPTIYSGTNDGWAACGIISGWASARSHGGTLVDSNNSSDAITVISFAGFGTSFGLEGLFLNLIHQVYLKLLLRLL